MPAIGNNQLLGLIVLAVLVFAILWLVRRKPYVRVVIFWMIRVELRDTPPEEPKKPRAKNKAESG